MRYACYFIIGILIFIGVFTSLACWYHVNMQADRTPIIAGDVLRRVQFIGYDGTAYQPMASIEAVNTSAIPDSTAQSTVTSGSITCDTPQCKASLSTYPPEVTIVFTGRAQQELFRVTPDGHVILSPGVEADEAARGFWQAVRQMAGKGWGCP